MNEQLPCVNCITLPICLSTYKDCVLRPYNFTVNDLSDRCELFRDFIDYRVGSFASYNLSKLSIIVNYFRSVRSEK
jgi:hypothetical protein